MRRFIRYVINSILKLFFLFPVILNYVKNSTHRFGMSVMTYSNEFKKYYKLYNTEDVKRHQQMEDFFQTKITLYSDNLEESPDIPTLIVVVKDEIERIKLLLDYYRKIGLKQFIVIDNNSSDGTREYVASQSDVRVYLVEREFRTARKEAWIEKVLAITGYNRWYIVVDADELIDYIGSEQHTINDLIEKESKNGKNCLQGYLLDMYSENLVFEVECNYQNIPKVLSWFDKDSYYIGSGNRIYGGPRYRVFGTENQLSKQAIFFFKPYMLYSSCHKLYLSDSEVREGRSYIIKHYKFLKKDFQSYSDRVKKQNYYNNSIEYKVIMDQIASEGNTSFKYEKSTKYVNSDSLLELPYLNVINW